MPAGKIQNLLFYCSLFKDGISIRRGGSNTGEKDAAAQIEKNCKKQ